MTLFYSGYALSMPFGLFKVLTFAISAGGGFGDPLFLIGIDALVESPAEAADKGDF